MTHPLHVGMDEAVKPVRIQLRRTSGWKMPPNTVIVDRRTKWGNPFTKANSGNIDPALRFAVEVAPLLDVSELRGKNLACWCKITDKDGNRVPCHADVLLEIANA